MQFYNFTYWRTGTLWEGRYKSCPIQAEHYLLTCYRYIELNSIRAGMVNDLSEYQRSSYHWNALGQTTKLGRPHDACLKLGVTGKERAAAYRSLFQAYIDRPLLQDVRDSINKGLALGKASFKGEIERLYGRRVKPASMGRSRTTENERV